MEAHTGDILSIELGDGEWSYGRVLKQPLIAFYDLRSNRISNVEEIIGSNVLFTIWVMNDAMASGRWPVIGSLPLEESLKQPVKFYKQDVISKKLCVC